MPMRDKIFVALDVPTISEAKRLVENLGDAATSYKIGYQLAFAGGLDFARELAQQGKNIFLDMKLHDIGNTVEKAVENIANMGVQYLTVHAYPQTIKAAVNGKGNSALKILAVTVLTSYDDNDVSELGFSLKVKDLVQKRALQARDYGANGLILSPDELLETRALVGNTMELITPGIRPSGASADDQKRIMTPARAFQNSANGLVIGRPIVAALNPREAMLNILKEIEHG
jgi:orotidine-5'-phosphate decarboxylase